MCETHLHTSFCQLARLVRRLVLFPRPTIRCPASPDPHRARWRRGELPRVSIKLRDRLTDRPTDRPCVCLRPPRSVGWSIDRSIDRSLDGLVVRWVEGLFVCRRRRRRRRLRPHFVRPELTLFFGGPDYAPLITSMKRGNSCITALPTTIPGAVSVARHRWPAPMQSASRPPARPPVRPPGGRAARILALLFVCSLAPIHRTVDIPY